MVNIIHCEGNKARYGHYDFRLAFQRSRKRRNAFEVEGGGVQDYDAISLLKFAVS